MSAIARRENSYFASAEEAEQAPLLLRVFDDIVNITSRTDRDNAIRILSKDYPADFPLNHYFAPNVYVREIFMPAGALVIGKLHATEHLNIITTGRCVVWTEQDGLKEYAAPYTFKSKAGTRKFLYIYADTTWMTVHVTEETDLEKLEDQLIIDDPIDGNYNVVPIQEKLR